MDTPKNAFESSLQKYYKPEEFDQLPFKFPQELPDNHPIIPNFHAVQQTTLKTLQEVIVQQKEDVINSTLPTIVENTTLSVAQEATSNVTDIIFGGGEMTGNNSTGTANNVTAVINEIFNVTSDAETGLGENSTETADLVTYVNATMREVVTTSMPEHIHDENNNTTVVILSIVVCVLIVSVVAGFLLYCYKRRSLKQAGNFEVSGQNRRQSDHVVTFTEDVSPGNCQPHGSNQSYLKSSQL